jgi:hypothetical protein
MTYKIQVIDVLNPENNHIRDATTEELAELKKTYEDSVIYEAEKPARDAREKRDLLLKESDWTQFPDVKLSNINAWNAYRQLLRNVPQQLGFPQSIDWPVKP